MTVTTFSLFCEKIDIDYYGIISQDADTSSMQDLASDLYYSQLTEINNYNVNDKRKNFNKTDSVNFKTIQNENLIFYVEILKKSNKIWTVSFNIIENGKQKSFEKEYDSLYKILLESKNELRKSFKNLIERHQEQKIIKNNLKNVANIGKEVKSPSLEDLKGTWNSAYTEEFINKIVILRNGNGFVILKNGASIHVEIKLEKIDETEKIIITQKNNSSPDYFPELTKTTAIDAAEKASPIQWVFTLYDSMKMLGTKTTIVQDKASYKTDTINVIWIKKQ